MNHLRKVKSEKEFPFSKRLDDDDDDDDTRGTEITQKSFALQMYSLDGRLSLQSLSELDSSRSWIAENTILTPTPPPPEDDSENLFYMGICLPRRLITIFPEPPPPMQPNIFEDIIRSELETTEIDEESSSEYDADTEHCRTCLVCYHGKTRDIATEQDVKLRR